MVKLSIQAAHEQVNPTELLNDVAIMERYGIDRCWSSDHYMPWWDTGASCGAAWPWMGSALAVTKKISVGTGVTAPILRYNPAIVAQVFATLGYMYPGRVFLGLGRGEALNEVTCGNPWPSNKVRYLMLKESLELIKKLWTEKWVNYSGDYYSVKDSNLYTRPSIPIPIYIAALGPQSAKLAGEEANGLVTNELDAEKLKKVLLPSFQKGAKKAGKDYESLEKVLYLPSSYDIDKDKAIQSLHVWKGAMIKAFFEVDVHDPRKIQENGMVVGNDVIEKSAFVITSAEEGIKKLQKYLELGFSEIVFINSSPDREKFVELVSKGIRPGLQS